MEGRGRVMNSGLREVTLRHAPQTSFSARTPRRRGPDVASAQISAAAVIWNRDDRDGYLNNSGATSFRWFRHTVHS
jgi:hypothetical protein